MVSYPFHMMKMKVHLLEEMPFWRHSLIDRSYDLRLLPQPPETSPLWLLPLNKIARIECAMACCCSVDRSSGNTIVKSSIVLWYVVEKVSVFTVWNTAWNRQYVHCVTPKLGMHRKTRRKCTGIQRMPALLLSQLTWNFYTTQFMRPKCDHWNTRDFEHPWWKIHFVCSGSYLLYPSIQDVIVVLVWTLFQSVIATWTTWLKL
jgi:hypothetical protein